MHNSKSPVLVAFQGDRRIARGSTRDVALAVHTHGRDGQTVVLDESTGHPFDLDVSGTAADVERRYAALPDATPAAPAKRPRGRPRLGVVGREVTLLPRHWTWLDEQRGGASAALRRLVDKARKDDAGTDRTRRGQDRTLRLMTALAGNRPGFEEACRALYAGDDARFLEQTRRWPRAVREVVESSAADAFERSEDGAGTP